MENNEISNVTAITTYVYEGLSKRPLRRTRQDAEGPQAEVQPVEDASDIFEKDDADPSQSIKAATAIVTFVYEGLRPRPDKSEPGNE